MSENSVQSFNMQLAWLGEILHEVTDLQFQERMAQCAAELDSSSIMLKIQGFLEKLQHIKQEQARANNVLYARWCVLSSFFCYLVTPTVLLYVFFPGGCFEACSGGSHVGFIESL